MHFLHRLHAKLAVLLGKLHCRPDMINASQPVDGNGTEAAGADIDDGCTDGLGLTQTGATDDEECVCSTTLGTAEDNEDENEDDEDKETEGGKES